MPRVGRMDIAAVDIVKAIEAEGHHVFTLSQLANIFIRHRDNWRLVTRTTAEDFGAKAWCLG